MANLDKIIIKNLKIFAFHGNNPEEKIKGQNFFIDCTIYLEPRCRKKPPDKLETTVSYSKIIKKIKEATSNSKYNLIETVAEKIADAIIEEFDKILKCDIIVKKPEAPIKNTEFDYVAVAISRRRADIIK